LRIKTIVHRAGFIISPSLLSALPPTPSSHVQTNPLNILAQPPNPLSVSLPHDYTAHEDLDRPDALERNLALARGLVQAQRCAELVLGDGLRVIDFVTEDNEGGVLELFHGKEGVELGFRFVETLVVFGVDEEDDARDFGDCGEG
jgi:hypothetical protein